MAFRKGNVDWRRKRQDQPDYIKAAGGARNKMYLIGRQGGRHQTGLRMGLF